MRFRLGNTGAPQSAVDGFGKGMGSLFNLPLLEAQAGEQYQDAEAKRALMQSQMTAHAASSRESDAHAALYGQQADAARDQTARGGIGELVKTAALAQGVPLSQVEDYSRYAQTGALPALYNQPADGNGPSVPAPAYADPQLGTRIMQGLGLTRQALTLGDKDVAHLADAAGKYQQQDAVRAVQADPSRAGVVGQSFAAADGKPLLDAIGNSGRGFNKFTGEGNTLAPGVAALFDRDQLAQIGQRNAAAGASTASAASSYASAAHSRASTDKTRAEMDQIVNGPKGVLVQTDAGPVFADPRTGASVAVRGPDGQPIVKTGAGPKLTEDQGKATGWLIQAENAYKNMLAATDPAAGGSKGALTPGFADAVARIPAMRGIGNWVRTDDRQKFLQGSSALSEALLRAATGAGVNKEEAVQKVQEVTPQFGDSEALIGQKLASIPLYIEGLKVRAGPGAPSAAKIVGASAGGGARQVTSDAEYNALPSGTVFTDPHGKQRRKP